MPAPVPLTETWMKNAIATGALTPPPTGYASRYSGWIVLGFIVAGVAAFGWGVWGH